MRLPKVREIVRDASAAPTIATTIQLLRLPFVQSVSTFDFVLHLQLVQLFLRCGERQRRTNLLSCWYLWEYDVLLSLNKETCLESLEIKSTPCRVVIELTGMIIMMMMSVCTCMRILVGSPHYQRVG